MVAESSGEHGECACGHHSLATDGHMMRIDIYVAPTFPCTMIRHDGMSNWANHFGGHVRLTTCHYFRKHTSLIWLNTRFWLFILFALYYGKIWRWQMWPKLKCLIIICSIVSTKTMAQHGRIYEQRTMHNSQLNELNSDTFPTTNKLGTTHVHIVQDQKWLWYKQMGVNVIRHLMDVVRGECNFSFVLTWT